MKYAKESQETCALGSTMPNSTTDAQRFGIGWLASTGRGTARTVGAAVPQTPCTLAQLAAYKQSIKKFFYTCLMNVANTFPFVSMA